MTLRIHSASRAVQASPPEVYQAFAEPGAMERWIAPAGMVARMLEFDFREGGSYRMRLTYVDPGGSRGKSAEDFDDVHVRLVGITKGVRIEQQVVFEADDPSFSGVMRMVWSFEPAGEGTLVTVRAEDVPEGILPEDHERGMRSALENLDAFLSTAPARSPRPERPALPG